MSASTIKSDNYLDKIAGFIKYNPDDRLDVSSVKEDRLQRVRALSYFLDNSIKLPVVDYRIGFDSIIGFIPVIGDAISAGLSIYIIYQAHQLKISKRARAKMIYNVALETVIGSIPVLGDVFDAAWKANARNCRILEKHLKKYDK
ncbi:MAG: DUF4112 domain-containing protein [Deltaproteobacteria bacterium]